MLPSGFLLEKRFKIHHHLSQGGFGITYIAWDTKAQQNVCIKEAFNPQYHERLPNGFVRLKDSVASHIPGSNHAEAKTLQNSLIDEIEFIENQFKEEAKILENLKGNYTPKSQGALMTNGTLYLILEFVEGPTLAKYIEQNGPMTPDLVKSIFSKLAHALEQMHHLKILHGDIAPDNIILHNLKRPVLIDFGSAQIAHPLGQPGGETQKIVPIKKHYSPPEFFLSAPSLKSDMYSLGATMYFASTGLKPNDARTRAAGAPLPGLENIDDSDIKDTILVATSLDPQQRFDRMRTLGEKLMPSGLVQEATPSPKYLRVIAPTLAIFLLLVGAIIYFNSSAPQGISPEQARNLAEAFFLNLQHGQPEQFAADSIVISLPGISGQIERSQLKSAVATAMQGIGHQDIQSWDATGIKVLNVDYTRKILNSSGQAIVKNGTFQFRNQKITFWEEL